MRTTNRNEIASVLEGYMYVLTNYLSMNVLGNRRSILFSVMEPGLF